MGDGRVEIVAAQGVVAADGQNIHHVFKAVHHRNIQRTAAEVIDQKGRVTLFRVIAGQGGGAGLVDEPLHRQAGQLARPLGGGPLGMVEVGGHADHRFGDRLAQKGLGVLLELTQHQCGKLLRAVFPPGQGEHPVGAHAALERGGAALRVADQPLPGGRTHQHSAILIDAHRAGGQSLAVGVGDQLAAAVLPDGGQTVGGSKVNA